MGSGSTGKAAAIEGFRFTGIEIDPEYLRIAAARIRHEADRRAGTAGPLFTPAAGEAEHG